MNEQLQSIEQVEALAARWGIELEASDYEAAQEMIAQRQRHLLAQQDTNEPARRGLGAWADRFNRALPRVLKAIMGIGNASTVIVYESIVGPGMLIALVLLLVVEQQRVFHGVSLFEVYEGLAWFAATVLVFANVALETQIARIEHRHKWREPAKHQFSLRIWALRLGYILGRGGWQAKEKSPALRFRVVLRIVTFSILILALAGSMKDVISKTDGDWAAALVAVLTQSTLMEMVTWLGGLLFAFAAVLTAQALSQYAAQTAIEISAALDSAAPDEKWAAALKAAGMSGAAVLYARLQKRRSERRAAGVAVASASAVDAPSLGGVVRVPNVSSVSDAPDTPAIGPAVARALEWLQAESGRADLSIRESAQQAGVSSATMQRAKAILKARGKKQ